MTTQSRPVTDSGSNPTTPLFRKSEWIVDGIDLEYAQEMVRKHHYSKGGSNTAVYTHGLFPRAAFWQSECVGCAWWLPPTKTAAMAAYPKDWNGVLALSRLVILPDVPKNACSFLIRHSMRLIDRRRWPCLLTYADDWRGHTGAIYRAAGFEECGKTKPERVYVRNGRMVSRKAGPNTRTHSEMLAIGCECVGAFSKTRFRHVV